MTFPLNEMYGYSRLCDRLRSSAIIWKQVSLRSSAIVCDHMETSLYARQFYSLMGNPCGVKGLRYAKSSQAQEWEAHCNIVFVLSSLFLFADLRLFQSSHVSDFEQLAGAWFESGNI